MVFYSLSPDVERSMQDRSGRPPDTLQHPVPLQHVPGATLVAVFFQQKYHYHSVFQTICHQWPMPECRSYFSFFYYDSWSDLLIVQQTNISSRSSWLLIILWMSLNVLCPLRYFIRQKWHIIFKKNIKHTDIQFSKFNPAGICQPAKTHPCESMCFGRPATVCRPVKKIPYLYF